MAKDSLPDFERNFKWFAAVVAVLSLVGIAFIVWVIIQLLDILRTAAS